MPISLICIKLEVHVFLPVSLDRSNLFLAEELINKKNLGSELHYSDAVVQILLSSDQVQIQVQLSINKVGFIYYFIFQC